MTDADLTAIATYLKSLPGQTGRRARPGFRARGGGRRRRDLRRRVLRLPRPGRQRRPLSIPVVGRISERPLGRSGEPRPRSSRRRTQRCDRWRADRPRHALVRMEAERRSGRRGPDLHSQLLGFVRAGRRPASSQSGPRLDGADGSIANTHRLRAVSLTQRSRSRRSRRICSSPNPRVKRRSAASTGKRSVRPSSRTAVMVCAQSAKAASAASSDEGPRRAASASALWRR